MRDYVEAMMYEQTKKVRSCVSCGKKSSKHELFRLVRSEDGSVCFDPTGKKAGRGAYICSPECLEEAIKTKRLGKALRTTIDQENYERIAGDMEPALREAQG